MALNVGEAGNINWVLTQYDDTTGKRVPITNATDITVTVHRPDGSALVERTWGEITNLGIVFPGNPAMQGHYRAVVVFDTVGNHEIVVRATDPEGHPIIERAEFYVHP